MIIVQTPLRVSLFGGGTDFRSFFLAEGGCVLSFTINKYIFVTIKRRFDQKLRLGWTRTEMVSSIDEIQHELIREALRKTGITAGVEITTMGDIPSDGSGLGSSSTVTVGALHAMYTYLGTLVSADQLAREACGIEIDTLGKPIGIQDQYIVAHGGLRFMEFTTQGTVNVRKINLDDDLMRQLNLNTMLFYTGFARDANIILKEQRKNIDHRLTILREMKEIAYTAQDALLAGNLDEIGRLLHESWLLKKQLASKISNPELDSLVELALKAGAIGGKITGAGGGGFLILYCPYERQEAVRKALKMLQELPFEIEPDGTKVIFNYRR